MGNHIWGKYAPKTPKKVGVNSFPTKTAKYKNRNISETINRIKPNLRIKLRPAIALRGWSNITEVKSNMTGGGHLKE